MDQNFTGLIEDPRTAEQKARDFNTSELASAAPVKWWEKPMSEWKKYSMRDQDGSSSCVGQGSAKGKEAKENGAVIPSAHPIYRSRAGFPSEGMWLQNAGEIWKKIGTTTEALDPSQFLNEVQMNRDIAVPTPMKEAIYIMLRDPKDIEEIASIIDKHGHCIAIFHSALTEWTRDVPQVENHATLNIGHCICFVDYFLYKGEKSLLADDSWGKATSIGNGGQRVVTNTFLKARFDGAMYFPRVNVPIEPQKPIAHFTDPLVYGMVSDPDVLLLQSILTYEGFFPAGEEYHKGNFKEITAWAVRKWQIAHGFNDFANETNPKKIRFGAKSIALANALYKA